MAFLLFQVCWVSLLEWEGSKKNLRSFLNDLSHTKTGKTTCFGNLLEHPPTYELVSTYAEWL